MVVGGFSAQSGTEAAYLYVNCSAGRFAYQWLQARGYRHLRRYAGGLAEWEESGYALAGLAA